MKKTILAVALLGAMITSSQAQGFISFSNLGGGIVAPVLGTDGVTRLAGDGYTAELWVADAGVTDVNSFTAVANSQRGFDSGTFAGFIAGRASPLQVEGVGNDQTRNWLVRAWDNQGGAVTSWEAALVRGQSGVLTDVGPLQGATSPEIPVLTGLESFSMVVVPEPSVIALAILGGGLLLFRRKK